MGKEDLTSVALPARQEVAEYTKPKIAVFTHIEKTAGVSAMFSFEQALGSEHILIYSPKVDRLAKDADGNIPLTSPTLEFLRKAVGTPVIGPAIANVYLVSDRLYQRRLRRHYPELEVPDEAKLISGHAVADQFDQLLGDREPIRGIMFREPLDRMVSQFNYFYRDRGGDDWRVRVPFKRHKNFMEYFEEYALLPEYQNYQTQALGGLDINQFDVVGVTENTDAFIEAFLQRLAHAGLTVSGQERDFAKKRMNINKMKKRIKKEDLDPQFVTRFKKFHEKDYTLYGEAKILAEAA